MTFRQPLLTAGLSIALFTACRPPEKPVTETEALDFAQKNETSITQNNENILNNVLDLKNFTGLVLRQANQRYNLTMAGQARASIANFHMGQDVLAKVHTGGSYQLVRRYAKDGHQHLLFRLVNEEGDLNYHDFELVKSDKGGIGAIDIYLYASGEQLSKTVTESLLARQNASRMTETERDNDQLVSQAKQFLTGGNPEEAWSFFVQLPDSVRKKLQVQRLHISIAEKLSDSALSAALKEYQAIYPRDPYIYLSSFKSDLRSKDFPAALDALNQFDSFLPSDPFLDIYRALIYKAMNNPVQLPPCTRTPPTWNPLNGNVIVELVDNQVKAGHPELRRHGDPRSPGPQDRHARTTR